MTLPNVENPNLEGADDHQPSVSPEKGTSIAGAPQNSQEFLELRRELELTRSELKGLQSRQDKERNEVQRFMDDVKAQMAKGKSLEEAEQAVYADRETRQEKELLRKIADKVLGDSPQKAAGNGTNAADEVAKVFAEYNVPMNHPEAAPLLELQGADLIKGVSKLALKMAKPNTPDASEATAINEDKPKPAGIEGLTRKYQEDMLKNRGNKTALKAIKEQARKDGVPVDSIVFV